MSTVGRAHPAKRLVVLRRMLEHNSDGAAREGVALPSKGTCTSDSLSQRQHRQKATFHHILLVSRLLLG